MWEEGRPHLETFHCDILLVTKTQADDVEHGGERVMISWNGIWGGSFYEVVLALSALFRPLGVLVSVIFRSEGATISLGLLFSTAVCQLALFAVSHLHLRGHVALDRYRIHFSLCGIRLFWGLHVSLLALVLARICGD